MKRIFMLWVLTLSLLITLVGCTQNPLYPTTDTNQTDFTKAPEDNVMPTAPNEGGLSVIPTPSEWEAELESKLVISCQYLPQAVDNPQNLPILKWVCLTDGLRGGTNRVWNEAAVQELNQMLAERDMPFRVQFVMMTMSEWLMDTNWFSRPEVQEVLKDADLIYGIMSANEVMEYLSPITEYVAGTAEHSLKNAVAHENDWAAAMINGEVYGIPALPSAPKNVGWKLDASFMSDYGLNIENFSRNYWEMDELFAEIYEKNGNEPFLVVEKDEIYVTFSTLYDRIQNVHPIVLNNSMPQTLQPIGSCYAIDHSGDTPAVVNILETDSARLIQQATMRYREAGYIVAPGNEKGKVVFTMIDGETAYTLEDGTTCIPIGESVQTANASGNYLSGIAAVSKHKTEAISLLNLIGEDEAFRMQLFFGKEGRDYVLNDGYYSLLKQEDGSDYSMTIVSPLAYFTGIIGAELRNIRTPGIDADAMVQYAGKTKLQTYREMMEVCNISYYPVVFDYSEFAQELTAVDDVFREYFLSYTNPKWMTEELYDQMLKELQDAGSGEIQAALQRQLEEYLVKGPA